jgi:hypothetical protein
VSRAQTENARAASMQYAAERAIDDPAKLAKAARIVRLALARGRLTPDELAPPVSTQEAA